MMQEGTRTTGAARLLWPLILGLGLALGLLWGLMPHSAVQAQAVNPGFTVDLFHGQVWGIVGPGEMVTVTGPGGVYGAAQADAAGFFWTPLWDGTAGTVAEIDDGDVINFYVEGTLDTTITVRDVTGQVDVLNDRVTGHIPGVAAGTAVTVTLKDWSGGEPPPGAPQATATTNSSGNFTADFSGSVNIGPGYWATVDYAAGSVVRDHLAPVRTILVDSFQTVDGYAQPGQAVSVDIYTGTTTLAETLTGKADKEGYYYVVANVSLDPGDLVEVDLGGGTVISTVVAGLSMDVDASADVVTGSAPAGSQVRVFFRRWEGDEQHYYEVNTTATGGVYTADFSGQVDLPRAPWISAAVSDSEGNETMLWGGDTFISVNTTWDDAWVRVDAAGVPVTATLDTGTGIYTWNGTSHPQYRGAWGIQFDDGMGGQVDIDAGHVLTVETSTWSDAMTVADVQLDFDVEADRVTGDAPGGSAELQIGKRDSGRYPVNDSAVQTLTLASPFDVTFPDFDLRFGGWIELRHFNTDGYGTVAHPDLPFVRVDLPWGVGGSVFVPAEEVTATLYYSDGVTVKAQTTDDHDNNPTWYWFDDWGDERIDPGDWVTVTGASGWAGGVQVVDLTVTVDEATDRMSGQAPVGLLYAHWDNWPQDSGRDEFVPTDESGSYVIDWSAYGVDVQTGHNLRPYYTALNGNQVGQNFRWPEISVNYGHDWVESRYEAGHTVWITVTDSGGTIKSTAELMSGPISWWGGETGFSTNVEGWSGVEPDIVPGDRVTIRIDDGYDDTVRVGTINGELDLDADTISGTIHADWFTQPLNARCGVWEPGGPGDEFTVDPDGGAYFCDFSSEWDVLPGQDVGVQYQEPDGEWVINVFEGPAPNMRVEKHAEGDEVAPGGPVVFSVEYRNEGDAEAGTVILTDTLPADTTYVTDTSGFPATVGTGTVTWSFGPVSAGDGGRFQVLLDNTASASDTLRNEVDIYTLYDDEEWNDHDESDVHVRDTGQPDLYVNKHVDPQDPAPGQTFLYEIDYGNDGPVPSGPVVLTDTLPENTTIDSWESDEGYELWSQVTASGDQLVLAAPTIPSHWGDRIYLRLRVDAGVPIDTRLTNTVEITTTGDSDPDNNRDEHDGAKVGSPRWDVGVHKEWGWGALVPGGEVGYNINYGNYGNMATQARLTDTLPAGTTFVNSTYWTGYNEVPVVPSTVGDGVVAWDLGTLEPGERHDFQVRVAIDQALAPGTAITNCATIDMPTADSWPYNNTSCAVETVRAAGPNLRVSKEAWWDWDGEIDYQIRIENVGTTRMEDIWITDTYPISTTFEDNWWQEGGSWITATHDAGNRQIIFWLDELGDGDTTRIRFRVDVDESIRGVQGLIFTNTVAAPWPGDVYPADNTDVELAYTGPDVYVEKWLSGGEPGKGEIVTFTVEFGNRNRGWSTDNRYGSHITDTLPAEMEFITATATSDPTQPWKPDAIDGNTLSWRWGTMWSNSTWYFDIVVRITDTVGAGAVLTNTIEAYGDSPYDVEPTYDNNVSRAAITIPEYKIYLPIVMRNS
jgi:uncharacterized repeat protein (TIGR01451 family)